MHTAPSPRKLSLTGETAGNRINLSEVDTITAFRKGRKNKVRICIFFVEVKSN